MPIPPCFTLAETLLPKVRTEAARRLTSQGWSQSRTGQALGVSQAMVSKYLATPAARDPLVQRLAQEWTRDAGQPTVTAAGEASRWCVTLATAVSDEEPLTDLLEAERLLGANAPRRLVPQIGLNLARARADARGPHEVLAFPGRLVLAGQELLSPAPPAWGGSNHLARCLLALRKRQPETGALASVRGGPTVVQALRRLKRPFVEVERSGRETDNEAAFANAATRHPKARILHDAGAVGIEPCLYIAGDDARAVANLILEIEGKVQP